MTVFSVADSEKSLPALIELAMQGERIELSVDGRQRVSLIPVDVPRRGTILGLLAGRLPIPRHFDDRRRRC